MKVYQEKWRRTTTVSNQKWYFFPALVMVLSRLGHQVSQYCHIWRSTEHRKRQRFPFVSLSFRLSLKPGAGWLFCSVFTFFITAQCV